MRKFDEDAPDWTDEELAALNPGPRVTYRPKEKICLFCGAPSAGYRRIVAQADIADSGRMLKFPLKMCWGPCG